VSAERAASAAPVGSSPPADGGVRARSSGPEAQLNGELWAGEDRVRHYAGRMLRGQELMMPVRYRPVQPGGQVRSAPELHCVARRLDVTP
jgi:hypothetical protein